MEEDQVWFPLLGLRPENDCVVRRSPGWVSLRVGGNSNWWREKNAVEAEAGGLSNETLI